MWIIGGVVILCIIITGIMVFPCVSNITNARTVGDLPLPLGFERVEAKPGSFAAWVRALPLKPLGTPLTYYNAQSPDKCGKWARWQCLNAAVLDVPRWGSNEDCAAAAIRLRAEYLFAEKRYSDIRFQNTNGQMLTYTGGNDKKTLERFVRKAYGCCYTGTLVKQMPKRKLSEVQPGDVFVYTKGNGRKMGHAITVGDVAINPRTGAKALLLIESNYPNRNLHVIRNISLRSMYWHIIDIDEEDQLFNLLHYHSNELYHW